MVAQGVNLGRPFGLHLGGLRKHIWGHQPAFLQNRITKSSPTETHWPVSLDIAWKWFVSLWIAQKLAVLHVNPFP